MVSEYIRFSGITAGDFEELAALRTTAMRESLEQIGRFDEERSRERLLRSFYPEHTEFILFNSQRIGFHTFRPADGAYQLDHLYVLPAFQSRGVGSHVINRLLSRADGCQMPVRVGALRGSSSNGFYQRHGFMRTAEDEWDIYYIRMPHAANVAEPDGSQHLRGR